MATRKAARPTAAYGRNVRLFGEWFAQANGKSLSLESITPIHVRQYRSYLLTVKTHESATVNRKVASLRVSDLETSPRKGTRSLPA